MPKPVKKRVYDSPVRKEQAVQTRTRVVDAAESLFSEQGYGPTTIKQIAERAGVAVDTVYAVFGNKARVLTAWMDARLSGPHGVANVMEVPEALAIRDAKDHRAQIKALVTFVDVISERVWPVNDIMRSAAAVEPRMREIYNEMHGYRFKNMSVLASWLVAKGKLRVDTKRAAETIWTLASPELWHAGRGGPRLDEEAVPGLARGHPHAGASALASPRLTARGGRFQRLYFAAGATALRVLRVSDGGSSGTAGAVFSFLEVLPPEARGGPGWPTPIDTTHASLATPVASASSPTPRGGPAVPSSRPASAPCAGSSTAAPSLPTP